MDARDAIERAARPDHEAWIAQIRTMVMDAKDADAIYLGLLEWVATLPSPSYVDTLANGMLLAHLKGRAEVLAELDDSPALAEAKLGSVTFKEAQEFLRQKVSLPTNVWTETLHKAHDRAFVVAGADSVALVEDIRGALDKAMNGGGGLKAFRESFDEIVLRHGWQYNGGRNWRTRVIYDTNVRTAHQAGRLAQMRDPDMIKIRPFWQYKHAVTREPKQAREQHVAWDGLVLRYDDPAWAWLYPPNGWKCSCGVITLSAAGMRRLGKSGPDASPTIKMRNERDPITGERIQVPEGVDFGWGYQPGDSWERGIVPREFQKPLALTQPELPLPVSPPLTELGRPFASEVLPPDKGPEFYAERFLQRFGASVGRGAFFRDKAGHAILISDALLKNADGEWKVMKQARAVQMESLAEAIFDPDEIWVDWEDMRNGERRMVRRYLRWDPALAAHAVFTWASVGWHGVTIFNPTRGKQAKPRRQGLERERRGALIFRRK